MYVAHICVCVCVCVCGWGGAGEELSIMLLDPPHSEGFEASTVAV